MDIKSFKNSLEYIEIRSDSFWFNEKEYPCTIFKSNKIEKYCVVIYGDGFFGSDAVYTFSSPEAADSFILFLQEQLLEEHVEDLKGFAILFELQVKHNLVEIISKVQQALDEKNAPE